MAMGEITKAASEVTKKASKELSEDAKKRVKELDRPINASETKEVSCGGKEAYNGRINELDKPLNAKQEIKKESSGSVMDKNSEVSQKQSGKPETDVKDVRKIEKMEPPIRIEFSCPDGMDRKEFMRQLKGQERGLNSQTIAENMKNREAFERRKAETGTGRDVSEGKKAQDIARQKAFQSRIESNQKKGMSYKEAKAEATEWIKKQAALHNPDQIAGGNPQKVSRMGDAGVNSSIGSQWRTRAKQLEKEVNNYAKGKTREELENTKMNVKLVVV